MMAFTYDSPPLVRSLADMDSIVKWIAVLDREEDGEVDSKTVVRGR
jgi:hypothetical protein